MKAPFLIRAMVWVAVLYSVTGSSFAVGTPAPRAMLGADVHVAATQEPHFAPEEAAVTGGPLEPDQRPAINEDVYLVPPASPAPVSGSGPVGSFTSRFSGPEESLADNGLFAITSTAPGTSAITGIVRSFTTGRIVAGAKVTMVPSSGGTSIVTTTDADCAFAFINLPVGDDGTDYDTIITKEGFGTFQVINDRFDPSMTYIWLAELRPTDVTMDHGVPVQAELPD